MLGMKHAAPIMMKQAAGSIINNGSVAGRRAGYSTSMIYGAAKAAVNHLTVCAAMQLGESGVRCNSISPGGIATGIFAKALGLAPDKADAFAGSMKGIMAKMQPIPRAGSVDDIANAAVFLASDESSFINGHDLVVDGGVVGGRLWTPHQEGVKAMRQAFGVDESDACARRHPCLVPGVGRSPATAAEPELTPFVADALWAPNPMPVRWAAPPGLRAAHCQPDGKRPRAQEGRGLGRAIRQAAADPRSRRSCQALLDRGPTRLGTTDLTVGQFGVLFLHVALEPGDALPRAIAHRISVRIVQPGIDFSATVARTPVVDRPLAVLGPPFAGAGYVAADGCCDSIRHVRALLALNGHFTLAQRFAIDWEQIDAENCVVKGDTKSLSNYVIYGREVLAVADGTVVSSRNDLPELPGALPQGMTIDQADGNFVVLDIGGGSYVLYAHMQPGSVTVKAGAKVKRGDVLGRWAIPATPRPRIFICM